MSMLPNRARALSASCSISAAFEASAAVISMGKPSSPRPAASAQAVFAPRRGHHISAFSSEERSSFAADAARSADNEDTLAF